MGNVVHKLTQNEIQNLMSKIQFETSNLPQGMKARTKHQNTTINIYNSGKVMFQGKSAETVALQLLPMTLQLLRQLQLSHQLTFHLLLNTIHIIALAVTKPVVAITLGL